MHDVLIAAVVVGLILSPCLLAMFRVPGTSKEREFAIQVIERRRLFQARTRRRGLPRSSAA